MSDHAEIAAAETQASGSSFYAGMRVLPKAERSAMFAIYAFCRKVDDIADEQGIDPAQRRADLEGWRQDFAALYAGGNAGQAAFLTEHIRRFNLRHEDFLAVIDGMQMDVDADIRAPDFSTLDLYCDRVASAVGRLSTQIFGMEEGPGLELAHHLGRALQLTNILRDIDEDAAIGRLYLAREWLADAGIDGADPETVAADPRLDAAVRPGVALAYEHYAAADRVLAKRPKGRLVAPRLMSAVYGSILKRMEMEGWAMPRKRVKIGKGALVWIVLTRGLLDL
jgi:phytoene synthase